MHFYAVTSGLQQQGRIPSLTSAVEFVAPVASLSVLCCRRLPPMTGLVVVCRLSSRPSWCWLTQCSSRLTASSQQTQEWGDQCASECHKPCQQPRAAIFADLVACQLTVSVVLIAVPPAVQCYAAVGCVHRFTIFCSKASAKLTSSVGHPTTQCAHRVWRLCPCEADGPNRLT